MKALQRQTLRPLWRTKPHHRTFQKDGRTLNPLNLSEFEAINRCEKDVPKYFNFASDVLDEWSKVEKGGKRPPTPALWWINGHGQEVRWSFEELGFLSRKVANVLSDPCGLQKGDRAILILPRVPEWWLLNVACIRTGTVSIPGTPQLTASDILYRLQASKAKCVITNDTLAPAVDSVSSSCPFLKTKLLLSEKRRDGWLNFKELFDLAPSDHNCVKTKSDEPMTIFFTSGTTGAPKMVEHTQSGLSLGLALAGRYWLDFRPSDVMWNMSDTGWVKAALGSVFAPWLRGVTVFIHSMPQFNPGEILNTLSKYPVTTLCTAPTVYRMLVQHDLSSYKFKSLRHCLTGGEPLNPEVLVQWRNQTGLNIYEGYGQTEVGMISLNEKGKTIKPGSMGTPAPPYDIEIIDENGNILPHGEEGDIAIRIQSKRPFCFFSRYVDNPEKTAATFRGNFYITGDRGLIDEDGYLWFVGRSDDVIISAGYRIGPFEVESALIEHPAVVESAVVSSPDPIRGESPSWGLVEVHVLWKSSEDSEKPEEGSTRRSPTSLQTTLGFFPFAHALLVVKAFIVLSPSFTACDPEQLTLELQDHVKRVTAPYKYPRKVEFVSQLPKTISGKIKRNELRSKEWGPA